MKCKHNWVKYPPFTVSNTKICLKCRKYKVFWQGKIYYYKSRYHKKAYRVTSRNKNMVNVNKEKNKDIR